jgi:hypothetical protein
LWSGSHVPRRANTGNRALHSVGIRRSRAGARGGKGPCGRSLADRRAARRDEERVPALGAPHLQPGRWNAPLVDLVRSLAGFALDLEHRRIERITHPLAKVTAGRGRPPPNGLSGAKRNLPCDDDRSPALGGARCCRFAHITAGNVGRRPSLSPTSGDETRVRGRQVLRGATARSAAPRAPTAMSWVGSSM